MKLAMHTLRLSVFAAMVACGGSTPNTTAPSAEPAAVSAPVSAASEGDSHLVLADLTIKLADGVIVLHQDGSVEIQGTKVGVLHADGRLVTNDNSTVQLMADGTIEGGEQFMRITVLPTGVVTHGGRAQVAIDDDGNVKPIESGSEFKLDGPKESWQAGMFLVIVQSSVKKFEAAPVVEVDPKG